MATWNRESEHPTSPILRPARVVRSVPRSLPSSPTRTDYVPVQSPDGRTYLVRESCAGAASRGSASAQRPTFGEWWEREGKAVAAFLAVVAMLIAMVVFAWGFVWVSPS